MLANYLQALQFFPPGGTLTGMKEDADNKQALVVPGENPAAEKSPPRVKDPKRVETGKKGGHAAWLARCRKGAITANSRRTKEQARAYGLAGYYAAHLSVLRHTGTTFLKASTGNRRPVQLTSLGRAIMRQHGRKLAAQYPLDPTKARHFSTDYQPPRLR